VDLPAPAPRPAGTPGGALDVRALENLGDKRSWTLAVHAPEGLTSTLELLLGPLPGAGAMRPLAAGDAPLTLASMQGAGVSPAGQVARSADVAWLYIGAEAERLAGGGPGGAAPGASEERVPSAAIQGALLACGWLGAEQALSLLGPALQTGGILSALGLGNLRVVVTTDGQLVRVRLTRLP
jgi:hypothetical protein